MPTDRLHWRQGFLSILVAATVFAALLSAAHAQVATPPATPTVGSAQAELLAAQSQAEEALLNEQVERLLVTMSPADRVGQLFIVTFAGADTSFNSDIAELIYEYRIGGVLLTPSKQNFNNGKGVDTPRQVATLANQLQALAYGVLLPADQALLPLADGAWPPPNLMVLTSQSGAPPPNLPLFIAIEQLGDALPNTALRREFTPLPSQMALGATWNTDLARKAGQIVGQELRAVGVNLLLGPNLDVFDQPRSDSVGALGLHTFGGSPYWVGQMGRAYIAGVHEGGQGRVGAVARTFPGQGAIDRLPDQEIATVQLGLEELRLTALAPFRNVTRQNSLLLRRTGDLYASDGLMTSHMRYNALPGQASPISLGPELSMTLEQEGFADWHNNGGILMSNAIGTAAIRRYYEATLAPFSPRRVALDLFSAGHDLIYLDRLSPDGDWATEKAAIHEIIGFFQERYNSDADFATQVDHAVRRLLRSKLRLYGPSFVPPPPPLVNGVITATTPLTTTAVISAAVLMTLPTVSAPQVLVSEEGLGVFTGTVRADTISVVGQVARESLTVLYPDVQILPTALPNAPQSEDRLLIFSDSRLWRECNTCTAEAAIGPDEIANIIIRLYGATGTGQIKPENVVSQTFADLDQLLRSGEAGAIPTSATTAGAITTNTASVTSTLTVTASSAPAVDVTSGELEHGEPPTQTAETLDKVARLDNLIDESNWLIFAMLDVDPTNSPNSDVVKRFLSQRDVLSGKNVIVLALNAPYFLDATEISKVTAYFGVYSKTRPFLESAVRALFRSYTPVGAPPVSVPGTLFGSLGERLQPDPNRPLEVRLLVGENELQVQPEDEVAPVAHVGNTLRLRVGRVLDRNGHSVPDGTLVNFELIYEGEALALNIESAPTRNGVALRDVPLDRTGKLIISVIVGAASLNNPIALDVQPTLPEIATLTPPATPAPPSEATVAPSPPPAEEPEDPNSLAATGRRINMMTLAIALFTIVITLCLLLIAQVQILPRQVLMHNMLWATIFGLGAYILYGLGVIPGVELLQHRLDVLGPAVVVFIAMLLPLLWLQLRTEQLQ